MNRLLITGLVVLLSACSEEQVDYTVLDEALCLNTRVVFINQSARPGSKALTRIVRELKSSQATECDPISAIRFQQFFQEDIWQLLVSSENNWALTPWERDEQSIMQKIIYQELAALKKARQEWQAEHK